MAAQTCGGCRSRTKHNTAAFRGEDSSLCKIIFVFSIPSPLAFSPHVQFHHLVSLPMFSPNSCSRFFFFWTACRNYITLLSYFVVYMCTIKNKEVAQQSRLSRKKSGRLFLAGYKKIIILKAEERF